VFLEIIFYLSLSVFKPQVPYKHVPYKKFVYWIT